MSKDGFVPVGSAFYVGVSTETLECGCRISRGNRLFLIDSCDKCKKRNLELFGQDLKLPGQVKEEEE